MGSSRGFGSTPGDGRAVHTRFRSGSACHWLNRPPRVTRRIILQKARRQPGLAPLGLRLHVSRRFQDLFHSPRRGAFHRSLTVLCAIGRCVYVAGCHGLWRRVPDGFRSPVAATGGRQSTRRGLATPPPQGLPAWHGDGLGCPRFARRYYGDTFCSSGYMRCFSSPGARRNDPALARRPAGCPIRRSWDQCALAAPPRLSQLCHVLHRHAAPRHPPSAPRVFPEGRPAR